MSDRRSTAIHEAGHAVMACCLGVAFECVTLGKSRDDKGATRNGGVHGIAPVTSKDQVENFVTVCLAGYAACHVLDVANYGFECDVKLASRTLWTWHDDPLRA